MRRVIRRNVYGRAAGLVAAWRSNGVAEFSCAPIFEGTDYTDGMHALGRSGVLSVVREILAERGEG